MLVHLKIKKPPKNKLSQGNFLNSRDDSCLLTRPIHCTKNQSTSKVKKLLTQRVSMQGSNFHDQPTNLCDQYETDFNAKEERKDKQKSKEQLQVRKTNKKQKSETLQISTLYKKSFKYNTTVHQIIKNFSKNNCKIKNHLTNKNCKTQSFSFSSDCDIPRSSIKSLQKMEQINNQKMTTLEQNLQKLQKMKDQYKLFYNSVGQDNQKKYNISQIEFTGKPRTTIASPYQWKTSHMQIPFSKYNWIHNSKLKKKLKQNILIEAKFNLMTQNCQNVNNLNIIQENPEINSRQISSINGNKQMSNSNIFQRRKQNKKYNQFLKTEEVQPGTTGRHSYREQTTKNRKKYSMDVRKVQHFEFIVDGWNTKQKQQYSRCPSINQQRN